MLDGPAGHASMNNMKAASGRPRSAVGMRSTACIAPPGEHAQRTPIDYIMWIFTGNDDCESSSSGMRCYQ